MKFKDRDPYFTDDPHYALLTGGYIKPEDFLEDGAEAMRVNAAIFTINQFLDEAESAGVLDFH